MEGGDEYAGVGKVEGAKVLAGSRKGEVGLEADGGDVGHVLEGERS